MRLYCCGKAVTGIGNVPKWEPVRRQGRTDSMEKHFGFNFGLKITRVAILALRHVLSSVVLTILYR